MVVLLKMTVLRLTGLYLQHNFCHHFSVVVGNLDGLDVAHEVVTVV